MSFNIGNIANAFSGNAIKTAFNLGTSLVPGLDKIAGGGPSAPGGDSGISPAGQKSGLSLGSMFGGGGGGFLDLAKGLVSAARQFFPGAAGFLGAVEQGLGFLGKLSGDAKPEAPEDTKASAEGAIGQARQALQTAAELKDMFGKVPATQAGADILNRAAGMLQNGLNAASKVEGGAQQLPAPKTADEWRAEIERLSKGANAALN
ncbi:MAG: hypothetical protein VKP72_08585 [bacterium]|nr:hypothetical protein [bacterium]